MKSRKKKVLLWLPVLAMFLCIAFAGCTKENGSVSDTDVSAGNRQEETSVLHLMSKKEYDYYWEQSMARTLAALQYPQIKFDDCCEQKYPALVQSLSELNQKEETEMLEMYHTIKADSVNISSDSETYEAKQEVYVRRSDSSVFSLLYDTYYYGGGLHGYLSIQGENYNTKTGERLKLSDVVTDMNMLFSLVQASLETYYGETAFYEDFTMESYFKEQYEDLVWVLDYQGITFFFEPYQIAPYSEGTITVTLPYQKYPDLIKKEYQDVPDCYGMELSMNYPFYYDLDGDGQMDELLVYGVLSEYDIYESYVIQWNGSRYELETYGYSMDPVLIHASNGKNYLYMQNTSDNDWRIMNIFYFENGSLYNVGSFDMGWHIVVDENDEYYSTILTDPSNFILDTRTDMLSTLSGYKNYQISSNGLPESSEQWYTLERQLEFTVLMPVKGTVVDEKTGNQKGERTLQAGEKVIYYRTDGESYADLRLLDGTIVRFMVSHDGWPYTVNGLNIEDVFEGLAFAG